MEMLKNTLKRAFKYMLQMVDEVSEFYEQNQIF